MPALPWKIRKGDKKRIRSFLSGTKVEGRGLEAEKIYFVRMPWCT